MTINETLQDPDIQENLEAVFFLTLLDLLDDCYKTVPMKDAREGSKMPWGLPFPVDEYLESINFVKTLIDPEQMVWLPLCEADGVDRKKAYIATKKPSPEEAGLNRPAVIICPGGGHGCSLAYETSARSWSSDMIAFMA